MPAQFDVRNANADDCDQIAAIYGRSVLEEAASFEIEPPDAAEMAQRMAAVQVAGFPYLVAVDDKTVLGYAYASAFRPRPAYRFTVENSVYVSPLAHRRGVARALLKTVIQRCEARGYRQMIAAIGGADNAASIGLHRALGFREAGRYEAVGFKFDRWHDVVLMQRALTAD
ncbi:MAG: N-acetyltransferase family protein [Pseudomonadota bacterium]